MVQVENEFGSYMTQKTDIPREQHRVYYLSIMKMLQEAGFNVPFFTSDGSWLFDNGAITGVLPTANGEGDVQNLKKAVDKYFPGGPYMVAEYYPGWLDHWTEPFVRISTKQVVEQVEKYLKDSVSFNIYMFHGGTNFGFTAGANYNDDHGIQPDITSYDYDAPVNEAGWATAKYNALRNLIQKYTDHPLPSVPAPIPVLELTGIRLEKPADFLEWKEGIKSFISDRPKSFEQLGQGYGYVLYSKQFENQAESKLSVRGLRDYALVFVNGKKVGELNRISNTYELEVNIPAHGQLDLLVENLGRINYGAEITNNTKGIISPVKIDEVEVYGSWKMYPCPMITAPDIHSFKNTAKPGRPAFYSGSFQITQKRDVFLDMRGWGKGIVFLNNINLGRYWKAGPQQTLYLPGCWLKEGQNSILIFEQQNDSIHSELKTISNPILDDLK